MFQLLLTFVVAAVATGVVVATLLPKLPIRRWWVRAWDFPRVHIAILAALAIPAALFVDGPTGWVAVTALALCLLYQCWRILPYTPRVGVEMRKVPHSEEGSQITILSSNVQMGNDRFADSVG